MTLLIIGGTGTLGSQIVRQALDKNYKVKCLVRSLKRSKFLNEWGADLIKADLTKPETLTGVLEGVKIIIDASASRPNDATPAQEIDLVGKLNLIRVAKQAKVKLFITFALINNFKYQNIPAMKIQSIIENSLKESKLNYTIFRLPAFFQGLIGQYGIPLLENNPIVVINESAAIPYIDTQDVAKISLKAINNEQAKNQIFQVCGPKAWFSNEIIDLCEKLSGQKAQTRTFPIGLINFSKNFASLFEWTWPVANRLAFTQVFEDPFISESEKQKVLQTFQLTESDFLPLEEYFKDYFEKILQDLQKLNFQKPKDLLF